MRWVESNLLNFGKVIAGVLIEHEFANSAKRELLLWPDMSQVKDVNPLFLPELFSFLGCHGLDVDGPLGIVPLLDGFIEILLGIVWRVVGGVVLGDELDALLRLHVKLAVDPVVVLVDEFDGVAKITMHEAIAIWNTSVTHQNHELMD